MASPLRPARLNQARSSGLPTRRRPSHIRRLASLLTFHATATGRLRAAPAPDLIWSPPTSSFNAPGPRSCWPPSALASWAGCCCAAASQATAAGAPPPPPRRTPPHRACPSRRVGPRAQTTARLRVVARGTWPTRAAHRSRARVVVGRCLCFKRRGTAAWSASWNTRNRNVQQKVYIAAPKATWSDLGSSALW